MAVSNSPPSFSRLTVADGLPSPSVFCVHQDREGFIWLGTANGLVRYDGHELLTFRPEEDGAVQPEVFSIRAIHEDRDGFLWVGGDTIGFLKFDPVSQQFLESYRLDLENGGLESPSVLSIGEAADGKLWIGTNWGGLHRFDPATSLFEHFQLREPEPSNTNRGVVTAIYASATDPDSVWLGTTWLGLVHLNAASGELRLFKDDPAGAHAVAAPGVAIAAIVADAAPGILLVGAAGKNRGLYRFDSAAGRFLERFEYGDDAESENSFGLSSVLRDTNGQIWVSSSGGGGLARFDPQSASFESYRYDPTNQQSLSQNYARGLFQDRSGLIWVATHQAGVCTFDPSGAFIQDHQFMDKQSSSPSPLAAVAILEDETTDGVFWLGSNEGLIRWERRSGGMRFYKPDPEDNTSLSHVRVRSFSRRRDGGFWIGTNGGLNHYDPAADRVIRFAPTTESAQALARVRIDALEETRDGKLWIAKLNAGGFLFDPATGEAERVRHNPEDPHSILPGWVQRLHEDRSGDVWFGLMKNGVARYSPSSGRFAKYQSDPASAHTLSDNRCRSIYEDPDHDILWIGTVRGLNRVRLGPDGHPIGKVERIAGLASRTILGIVAGERDSLWLSTPDGLVRMGNRNEATPETVSVDQEVGPILLGFNAPAIKSRSGELLFGTMGGLIEVRPERFESGRPPPVAITGVQIGSGLADRSQSENTTLTHEQNKVITFKFAALDFVAPDSNRIVYRLEGFENEWRDSAGDHQATYTTLRPGSYTFQVKAANSRGVWNDEGASFAFTILPHWTATPWFRGMLAVGIIGGGLAFIRLRVRGAHRRADELQAEVHKRDLLNRELQIGEQRFQNLITNTSEHVWCIEFDEPLSLDLPELDQVDAVLDRSHFAEVNEAMAEAYGTTTDKIIGEKFSLVMPRSLPTTVPLLLDVIRSNYEMRELETVEQAADGSERIMVNNLVGAIEDGKLLRVWGTARDITDQKDAEKLRDEHRDELAHASRVATMGGLTAAIAHELNQPLAAIGANTNAAIRFMEREDPDLAEVREILTDILADNQRAAEVIRRMRNLLKKQVGEDELLDLNELIEGVEVLVNSDAIIRKIEIERVLATGIPKVRAGRVEIQQVLLNLIVNGFDAMDSVPPDDRRLILGTDIADSGELVVSVTDSGPGLDDTEAVFEPFLTSKQDGLGMGLAINETIVETYGGKIWAERAPGGGAKFCFSLPPAAKPAE